MFSGRDLRQKAHFLVNDELEFLPKCLNVRQIYFRMPETKGRKISEIQAEFAARKGCL